MAVEMDSLREEHGASLAFGLLAVFRLAESMQRDRCEGGQLDVEAPEEVNGVEPAGRGVMYDVSNGCSE